MMTVTLLAEIDGQAVPLSGCDWVKWAPCGCPVGVTVARLAVTEEDAWKTFHERKRDIERVQRQGYRMELVTHTRWSAEIMHLMSAPCPHKPGETGREKADGE